MWGSFFKVSGISPKPEDRNHFAGFLRLQVTTFRTVLPDATRHTCHIIQERACSHGANFCVITCEFSRNLQATQNIPLRGHKSIRRLLSDSTFTSASRGTSARSTCSRRSWFPQAVQQRTAWPANEKRKVVNTSFISKNAFQAWETTRPEWSANGACSAQCSAVIFLSNSWILCATGVRWETVPAPKVVEFSSP